VARSIGVVSVSRITRLMKSIVVLVEVNFSHQDCLLSTQMDTEIEGILAGVAGLDIWQLEEIVKSGAYNVDCALKALWHLLLSV